MSMTTITWRCSECFRATGSYRKADWKTLYCGSRKSSQGSKRQKLSKEAAENLKAGDRRQVNLPGSDGPDGLVRGRQGWRQVLSLEGSAGKSCIIGIEQSSKVFVKLG